MLTIGLLGRLGGVGARQTRWLLSDEVWSSLFALAALAAKLLDMQNKGDILDEDVFISTHICPDAPLQRLPIRFLFGLSGRNVPGKQRRGFSELDAILSVDTTKGNLVINTRGFAISPAGAKGRIYFKTPLRSLLELMASQQEKAPYVPAGNSGYHPIRKRRSPSE